MKRHSLLPKILVKPPAYVRLRRVVYADGSSVVFSVPRGADFTRSAVQNAGTPLYRYVPGDRWRPWSPAIAPWSEGRKPLGSVPLVTPDPVVVTLDAEAAR